MRKVLLGAALLLALSPSVHSQSPADVRAIALVDEMMKAMGGLQAWEQARYLRFDWVVERDGQQVAYVRHLWDKHDGRYRVEWTARDAAKLAVLFDINTRSGQALVNGQPARDEDEQKYLDQAYGRFINDSYWLLMPWKLKDPGVKLAYAGEVQIDNSRYEVVHVSFEQVGLTPGDQYWAYINPRTHMMDMWAYFLQSMQGTPARENATPWQWRRYELLGGVRLARERVRVGENARIHFPVLEVSDTVDQRLFESFDVPLPGPPPAAQ